MHSLSPAVDFILGRDTERASVCGCVSAGLKLAQCDFVAVNNGITVTKSCLQLNVINNHINARTACINGAEINQSCIMGNLFYKDPSSQGATVGVQIHGNSAWNVIANNVRQQWCMAAQAYDH